MKMKTPLNLLLCSLALCAGCASFSTTQLDERLQNPDGSGTTKITTKVSSRTFFESKSNLSNFAAKQSAASQSANVGSLSQESSATNVAPVVKAVFEGIAAGAVKAAVPASNLTVVGE